MKTSPGNLPIGAMFAGPPPTARKSEFYKMKAEGKRGEIYIYDVIGGGFFEEGTTAAQFAKDLKELGRVSELDIFINSPGGQVFQGIAIYNQLARHKARKRVMIDGIAASIASVIAMAGDEIAIAANGMMMIHDPYGVSVGTAEEMRKMADALEKVRDVILETYVSRTGADRAEVRDMMAEETWMDAPAALDLGFADEITEAVQMAAAAKFDLSRFRHVPEQLSNRVAAGGKAKNVQTDPGERRSPHPAIARMRQRIGRRNLERRAGPADVAAEQGGFFMKGNPS